MSPSRSIFVVADLVGEVGGASKATRLLCEALVALGAETTLFVTGRPEDATRARLERSGVSVRTALVNRGWRAAVPSEVLACQVTAALYRARPSSVIVVGTSATARRILRLRPPVPVWIWETTEALPHVRFIDLGIRPHLKRAAGLLVPSQTVGENAKKTYGFAGRIERLPFWVEPPARVPNEVVRSGALLFLGRLDMDKGFRPLFEAFCAVRATRPDARLVVCGGGDIEGVRRSAGEGQGIDVRGYVSQAEIEAEMERCEGLVLPSLHEGYPLTLLEACGRGRPIIATEVGSIPEVYGGRDCAILVPPGQAAPLADAMRTLLSDSPSRREARRSDALRLFSEVSSPEAIRVFLERIVAC